MRVVEKDGKKYLVLLEGPDPPMFEISEVVEELPDGSVKVKLSPEGPEIIVGPPVTEKEGEAIRDEYNLNPRQEEILKYLFERNEPIPFKELANVFAPRFDVSKDTIHNDLEELIREQLVERPSRGLYKITKSGMSYLGVRPPGLYYECTEAALLKALELVAKAEKEGKIPEDLYMTIVDALDCLRDIGRMYKEEWDIEVPLD